MAIAMVAAVSPTCGLLVSAAVAARSLVRTMLAMQSSGVVKFPPKSLAFLDRPGSETSLDHMDP